MNRNLNLIRNIIIAIKNNKLSAPIPPDARGLEIRCDGDRSPAAGHLLCRHIGRHRWHPDGRAAHFRIRRPGSHHRSLPRQVNTTTTNADAVEPNYDRHKSTLTVALHISGPATRNVTDTTKNTQKTAHNNTPTQNRMELS